mgnify:CR=1 FL=1
MRLGTMKTADEEWGKRLDMSTAGVARVKASRAMGDELLARHLEESVKKAAREDTSKPQGTGQYGTDVPSTQEASTSSSSTSVPPRAPSRKRGAEGEGDQGDAKAQTLPAPESRKRPAEDDDGASVPSTRTTFVSDGALARFGAK